jgi:hypothetical protein
VVSAVECPVKVIFGQPAQDNQLQHQNPPHQAAIAGGLGLLDCCLVCHGTFHGAEAMPSLQHIT